MAGVHGTSKFIQCKNSAPLGTMQFQDFAPAPCSCCAFCAPHFVKERMYAHVYENRIESNFPIAPFGPCTCDEKCVIDIPALIFHDRIPSRAGMCCFVVPCTCCGPPVLYVKKPKFCMVDTSSCFGEEIHYAPCNCFGCKQLICLGAPCYTNIGRPLFQNVKDADAFLAVWSGALNQYFTINDIPEKEKAIFEIVTDDIIIPDFMDHRAKGIAPDQGTELSNRGGSTSDSPAQQLMG
jgi:hypothetical protein